jgi:predicted GH43/DUF377 family glycosyl hydrolase
MIEHLHGVAVHAYYCGEMEAGRRACEALLRKKLPDGMEHVVRRNRTWYTHRLEELASTRFRRIDVEPAFPGWSLFNPSIIAETSGWIVNVRSSNYRIVEGRYEMPPEDNGVIRTENLLVTLDDDMAPTYVERMPAAYERTAFPVDGLEDVRLNEVDGRPLLSATVRNFAPYDGTCRIGVGYFDSIRCHPTGERHEKNWMPILGRARWLYACNDGGQVATVAEHDGAWLVERHAPSPHIAAGFRGGSQLVPIGGSRWLALIHEVAEDDGKRIYEHRFVEFDSEASWAITGISMPFAFLETRAIEFAAGLARRGDRLVASFGVRDAEAWIVELTVPEVRNLLTRP